MEWHGIATAIGIRSAGSLVVIAATPPLGPLCSCLARMEALSAARRRLKPLRTRFHGVWLCGRQAKPTNKNYVLLALTLSRDRSSLVHPLLLPITNSP